MSKFAKFMKANKVTKANEKYAPTASLLDENGKPLEWEFRQITSKENDALREACTVEVQVTGKPNLFRPKTDTAPDLYDKELQDSYGVMTPEDLVYAMVDNAGEYQDFVIWMQNYQGFTKSFDEKVDEAKN